MQNYVISQKAIMAELGKSWYNVRASLPKQRDHLQEWGWSVHVNEHYVFLNASVFNLLEQFSFTFRFKAGHADSPDYQNNGEHLAKPRPRLKVIIRFNADMTFTCIHVFTEHVYTLVIGVCTLLNCNCFTECFPMVACRLATVWA